MSNNKEIMEQLDTIKRLVLSIQASNYMIDKNNKSDLTTYHNSVNINDDCKAILYALGYISNPIKNLVENDTTS